MSESVTVADQNHTTNSASPAPTSLAPVQPANVEPVLDSFQVIADGTLRRILLWLPIALGLFLVVDWLDGIGLATRDLYRLTGLLLLIVEFAGMQFLFGQVCEALRTVWTRGIVGAARAESQPRLSFAEYLRRFQATLDSRQAHVVAALFALAMLAATYPITQWLATGRSPYVQLSEWFYFYFATGAIVEPVIAYLLGLCAWRYGVIALYIARLGQNFHLNVQPAHPDHSGGLRPLGNVCLTSALLLLMPAIYFGAWIELGSLPAFQSNAIWAAPYKGWLLVLAVGAAFFFVRPLYEIHRQMEAQRQVVMRELDELSLKMEQLALELRTRADQLTPAEGAQRMDQLKFMSKVYQDNSQVPTWPFDWTMLVKFVAAEAVPVLSLTGASGPLLKIVQLALSLFPQN